MRLDKKITLLKEFMEHYKSAKVSSYIPLCFSWSDFFIENPKRGEIKTAAFRRIFPEILAKRTVFDKTGYWFYFSPKNPELSKNIRIQVLEGVLKELEQKEQRRKLIIDKVNITLGFILLAIAFIGSIALMIISKK